MEKKIARFNKSKVAAMAALNKKSLMKSQIMLEHCQVEIQLKDKEHKYYIIAMEHQFVIQNYYKPTDQLVKDASIARKAYQNHAYAMQYVQQNNFVPTTTKATKLQ